MTHGHFIERCRYCDKVISQCRCMSTDKMLKLGICDGCKDTCKTCGGSGEVWQHGETGRLSSTNQALHRRWSGPHPCPDCSVCEKCGGTGRVECDHQWCKDGQFEKYSDIVPEQPCFVCGGTGEIPCDCPKGRE